MCFDRVFSYCIGHYAYLQLPIAFLSQGYALYALIVFVKIYFNNVIACRLSLDSALLKYRYWNRWIHNPTLLFEAMCVLKLCVSQKRSLNVNHHKCRSSLLHWLDITFCKETLIHDYLFILILKSWGYCLQHLHS